MNPDLLVVWIIKLVFHHHQQLFLISRILDQDLVAVFGQYIFEFDSIEGSDILTLYCANT